jgi:hypothetical protein
MFDIWVAITNFTNGKLSRCKIQVNFVLIRVAGDATRRRKFALHRRAGELAAGQKSKTI